MINLLKNCTMLFHITTTNRRGISPHW